LMQLQPAVRAARFLRVIEHHRGLITSWTQAGRDEGQRWQLHVVKSR
jgi:hypothetical protein